MDRAVLLIALVISAGVVSSSCGPTIAPCTAESCAAGCCDENGVCVAGRTSFACGSGGAACAVCATNEVCVAAPCVLPAPDAGLDAGVDAGLDAGAPFDAGTPRSVTFARTAELLVPDGGTRLIPNQLSTLTASLYFELPTGEFATRTPRAGGTSLVFDDVAEGPYTIVYERAGAKQMPQSDAPLVDVGPRLAGKRTTTVTMTTLVTVDAGLPGTWEPGDSWSMVSFAASMYRDGVSALRQGTLPRASANLDVSLATLPYEVAAGDDLSLVYNRNYPDAGPAVLTAALYGVTLSSPAITNGMPLTLRPDLTVLPREGASLTLRSSEFAQFATDVNPNAISPSHRLQVFATFGTPGLDGGDYESRSPSLMTLRSSGTDDLSADVTWGSPYPELAPINVYRATGSVVVPLTYQGRTLNRSVDAFITQHLASPTASIGPELTAPRFPRINGETAFVDRNGVSVTPVLEWSPPQVGVPTQYSISLWRLAISGTNLTQTFGGSGYTAGTRFRVPPGVLMPGEAYFAFIVAQRLTANDVRVTPIRTSRVYAEGTAMTNVFTP